MLGRPFQERQHLFVHEAFVGGEFFGHFPPILLGDNGDKV
jgi:hypothetical protein